MALSIYQRDFEFILIDPAEEKVDQLKTCVGLQVHYFPNVSSFNTFLRPLRNTSKHLILVTSIDTIKSLSSDIKQKVREVFVYAENCESSLSTFSEVCLNLCGFVIMHFLAQSHTYYRSNDDGLARTYTEKSLALNKILTQKLELLQEELDEKIKYGEEEQV
ncbi:unnamed protein product [Rotaria sordida]|uniref:Uncharacterized protein n=1 Tax=Rotaria sordida TaxID=392033 RepID=A0A813UQ75_9BILA|nr:unnamed protein product [Rotaria sordida]CAF3930799.1 unnamed protein product [Rotaria sordida]